jgi:hypothetical protein
MVEDGSLKLPLREAYKFGAAKGLGHETDEIRQMKIQWPPNTLRYGPSLRCGYIVDLFQRRGVFEEFTAKHWPNGNTPAGEKRWKFNLRIKQHYETLVGAGKTPKPDRTLRAGEDWIEEVVNDLGAPEAWAPGVRSWMQTLSATLARVKAADLSERSSRAFQQFLWEENGVAAVGQGNISINAALDDADFRDWLAARSLTPIPEDASGRRAHLAEMYEELRTRLSRFTDRTPHLKIFRVLAALYPTCMTTVADARKLRALADHLGIGRELSPAESHVLLRERLDPILESTATAESLTLPARMVFPWLLYERLCTPEEESAERPIDRPQNPRLSPLPAVQRLRGLTYLPEGFDGILTVLDFVRDGLDRDELIELLRGFAQEYKPESLPSIGSNLQSQFNVIRRDGNRFYLTERGEKVLATRDPAELGDWLLTHVFGVDHVLVALRDRGPSTSMELISLLRGANPNWKTDFVPRSLIGWLRSLRAVEIGDGNRLILAPIGRQWLNCVDWVPEPLSAATSLDQLIEEPPAVASEPTPAERPAIVEIVAAVQKNARFDASRIASLHAGLWSHPRRHFAVLTGISGSGKTLLAREYATALTGEAAPRSILTIPVEPGWYDPSPLFGYPNPIHPDRYVRRPFLDFLLNAADDPSRPYVAILDEMNLSHPEQYMAPLLSAMETGGLIPLHNNNEDLFDGMRKAVRYPSNLALIGTVNMDETTHGLSDKVLDRAFVLEFWDIELAGYDRWGTGVLDPERENRVRGLLQALMDALTPARLHFGWRVVDDIFDYLIQTESMSGLLTFDLALDTAVCSKVLPKLRGEDSIRFRTALEGCHRALTDFDLPCARRKVEDLQADLRTMGSARYWR